MLGPRTEAGSGQVRGEIVSLGDGSEAEVMLALE